MNHYRVVYIQGQGYNYFTPENWAKIPALHRSRVHVLAMSSTKLEAQKVCDALPPGWVDKPGLCYCNGEWLQSTGKVITHAGQQMEVHIPADRPVPVIQHQG